MPPTAIRSVIVLIVTTDPRHTGGQIRFIATLGNQVKEVVGSDKHIQPASVTGIGMENISSLFLVKNADPRAFRRKVLARPVVVIHLTPLALFWREGNMIIA